MENFLLVTTNVNYDCHNINWAEVNVIIIHSQRCHFTMKTSRCHAKYMRLFHNEKPTQTCRAVSLRRSLAAALFTVSSVESAGNWRNQLAVGLTEYDSADTPQCPHPGASPYNRSPTHNRYVSPFAQSPNASCVCERKWVKAMSKLPINARW